VTTSDRPAFAALLALLGEAFNEPLSDARSAAYWLGCEDLPLAAAETAVRRALRECRFFPRPAELRALAGETAVSPGWVNQMLSEGLGGKPVGPFVQLFVDRLGGWRGVEDRLPLARLPLVERLYPGIVAACRAREIPIPTETSVLDDPTALRRLAAGDQLQLPEPEED
jgi:hypothetical protein